MSLEKKDYGQFGFNIHHDGVVTEVEQYNLAYLRGIRQGTRIVKIEDHYVINLNHERMIDLLRKSNCLKVCFLLPMEDGSARRGQDENFSLYAYLSTFSSINERQIDSQKNEILSSSNQSRAAQLQQHDPVQSFSPQRQRRLNSSSNISKLIQRLSTSGLAIDSAPSAKRPNHPESPRDKSINGNVCSNSYYYNNYENNGNNLNPPPPPPRSPKKSTNNESIDMQ